MKTNGLKYIYKASDCTDSSDCLLSIEATKIFIAACVRDDKPVRAAYNRLRSLENKLEQFKK